MANRVDMLVQRAQAEARARASAPTPTPAGIPMPGDVIKFLKQYTAFPLELPLTNGDYRDVLIRLRGTLTTATTSTTDEYKVPTTHMLLIQEIRGTVAFNDPDGETLSITGLGNPFVLDRIAIKGMNCRATLQNTDRSAENIIGENRNVPLSSLMEVGGGAPVKFSPPHPVLAGQALELAVELTDTAAAIVGGSTDYGILINATLVRTRAG